MLLLKFQGRSCSVALYHEQHASVGSTTDRSNLPCPDTAWSLTCKRRLAGQEDVRQAEDGEKESDEPFQEGPTGERVPSVLEIIHRQLNENTTQQQPL